MICGISLFLRAGSVFSWVGIWRCISLWRNGTSYCCSSSSSFVVVGIWLLCPRLLWPCIISIYDGVTCSLNDTLLSCLSNINASKKAFLLELNDKRLIDKWLYSTSNWSGEFVKLSSFSGVKPWCWPCSRLIGGRIGPIWFFFN